MTSPYGGRDPYDELPDADPYDSLPPARRRATDTPQRRASDRGALGTAGSLVRSALQGATFGFSDELAGGIAAAGALLPGGRSPKEAYTEERDKIRAGLKSFHEEHPIMATGTELAGAILPAIATGGASTAGTLSTGGRIAAGAKAGAKLGAAYGLGKAEGSPIEQGVATATGGVLGGVVGGALPAAGSLLRGAKGMVQRGAAKAGSTAAREAVEATGQEEGASMVLRALEREGLSPAEAQARIQAARAAGIRDVALADVAPGGNVKGLLDLAATRPGEAQTAVRKFTEQRAGGMRQTLADALDQHTGLPPRNLYQLRTDLVAARDKAANEVFEPMFARTPFVDDPAVAAAVETVERASPRFKAHALRLAQLHGVPTEQLTVEGVSPAVRSLMARGASRETLAAQGFDVGTETRIPSLRYVHYLKESIDREIAQEMQGAQRGGSKSLLSGLQRLKDKLRGATVEAVPEYGKALGQYADDSEVIRAMELGKRLLWSNTDPVEMHTLVSSMAPGERDVFRTAGAAAARQFLQGKAALAPTPTNAWWNNPAVQGKLRLLFEDDQSFQHFMEAVAVTRQKALTGQAGGNSMTASRLFADQDLGEQLAGGLTASDVPLIGGVVPRLVRGGLRRVEAATKQRALKNAAPYLTSTGRDLDEGLRRLALENALLQVPQAASRGQSAAAGGFTGRGIGQLTETREPRALPSGRAGAVGPIVASAIAINPDTPRDEEWYTMALMEHGLAPDAARREAKRRLRLP